MSHRTTPMKESDEATEEQLEMAQDQGDAYVDAVLHMAEEVATDGGEKPVGDYVVAYAVEDAEGMYQLRDGKLEWQEPGDRNLHVEISVRDAADGRFIPGLHVELTIEGPDGETLGTESMPFLWHPWVYHYGRNWKVPGDGEYTFHVRIATPTFPRHDRENGRRYAEDVTVTFEQVQVETGRD